MIKWFMWFKFSPLRLRSEIQSILVCEQLLFCTQEGVEYLLLEGLKVTEMVKKINIDILNNEIESYYVR